MKQSLWALQLASNEGNGTRVRQQVSGSAGTPESTTLASPTPTLASPTPVPASPTPVLASATAASENPAHGAPKQGSVVQTGVHT
jgi:hypothetical protein